MVKITDLNNDDYQLLEEIEIVFENEEGTLIGWIDWLNLWADGENEDKIVEELKSDIIWLYKELNSGVKLGVDLRNIREKLNKIIIVK